MLSSSIVTIGSNILLLVLLLLLDKDTDTDTDNNGLNRGLEFGLPEK